MEYYVLATVLSGFFYASVRMLRKRDAGFIDFLSTLADLLFFPLVAAWREYKREL